MFVRYADIDDALVDPGTGMSINKVVFMVFFQVRILIGLLVVQS